MSVVRDPETEEKERPLGLGPPVRLTCRGGPTRRPRSWLSREGGGREPIPVETEGKVRPIFGPVSETTEEETTRVGRSLVLEGNVPGGSFRDSMRGKKGEGG